MHTCPICHEDGVSSFRRWTLLRRWPTRCQLCEGLVTAEGAEGPEGCIRPPRASHDLVFVLGYTLGADAIRGTAKDAFELALAGFVLLLLVARLWEFARNARRPLVPWESAPGGPRDR